MDTSGGFFRKTSDIREEFRVLFVNVASEVTTIVEDHVQRLATSETFDSLVDAPVVFLISLTLPGEDGDAGSGYSSGSMVLGGEDVLEGDQIHVQDQLRRKRTYARGPGDLSTESSKSLNQDGGLDGHVQASSDASPFEGLCFRVLFSHVHETWHLMFGDFDLLTAKGGEGYIYRQGRDVIRKRRSQEGMEGNIIPAILKVMARVFFLQRG